MTPVEALETAIDFYETMYCEASGLSKHYAAYPEFRLEARRSALDAEKYLCVVKRLREVRAREESK